MPIVPEPDRRSIGTSVERTDRPVCRQGYERARHRLLLRPDTAVDVKDLRDYLLEPRRRREAGLSENRAGKTVDPKAEGPGASPANRPNRVDRPATISDA
jgi:hypothetical protein